MSARATFKQDDVRRLVNGAVAAGLSVARVEFNDNGIVIVVGEPEKQRRHGNSKADDLYGPQA